MSEIVADYSTTTLKQQDLTFMAESELDELVDSPPEDYQHRVLAMDQYHIDSSSSYSQ